jgi:hypothetical protein
VTAGSKACDYLLRLLPCILGIIGIPLSFLLCRNVVKDSESSLIAAFLFAISPFQIYYAQELRPYSLYVALSLAAFIFLVQALEENRLWQWVALTACLVLSMYAHFFSVWNLALMNLYLVATFKTHKKLVRRWFICQCVVILFCLPALISAFRMNSFFEQAEEHWFPRPDFRTPFITFKNFFAGYSPNRPAYTAILLVCALFLVLGLYALRKKRNALVIIAILAFVPIGGNLLLWRIKSYSFYSHRLLIFSAIPCYVLVALGMRALRKTAFTIAAIGLLACLTVPCLADHYSHRLHPSWRHRLGTRYKVQNREAAHYIAERLADGDFVGHTSHFTWVPFEEHYLRTRQGTLGFTEEERTGILRGYPDTTMWETTGYLPARIESVVRTARRLWLVESWWEPFDLDPLSRQLVGWLNAHCIREERKPFDGVTVYLYRTDPELRAAAETNQLADYGDRTDPYYLFPESDKGISAEREWRRRFLARSVDSPDQRPSLYGVQFDFAVAQDHELSVQGQQLRADFLDGDGDGERDTLSLTEIGALVREEATATLDSVDYSLLAMDGDQEKAVLASFPVRTSGDFTYRFVVRNATDVTRTVQCSVRESAHVIEAVAFSRSDPESDVWRPSLEFNFHPPPRFFNRVAMTARLTDELSAGDAIHSPVRLSSGHYAVFARILEEANAVNQSRANLRFSILPSAPSSAATDAQLIGTVKGNNPSAVNGWAWRKVGELQCEGEPFRLVVAARNDDNLPRAFFDLGSVMFVPVEDHVPVSPVEAERFEVTLGPFEEKQYTRSSSLGEYQIKRIDVELFHAASKEFRNIFFHVRREGR